VPFIEETENKLYKKGENVAGRPNDPDILNPANIDIKKADYKSWQTPPRWGLSLKTKKILLILLGVFIFLIAAFYALNKYLEYISFSVDKIDLVLDGPAKLMSGSSATWKVSIINKNKSAIENTKLIFNFPEGSYIQASGFLGEQKSSQAQVDLYNIEPGQRVDKEFSARVVAPENSVRVAQATILFKPKGITRQIEKSIKFTTSIGNFPVILSIEAPNEIFPNKEVFYKINYINSSQEIFSNLRVKVQYPEGFLPNEFDPAPSSEKNIWQINRLGPSQEGQIKIKGILQGQENDKKTLTILIEAKEGDDYVVFKKETAQTNIVSSPLALEVKVNGRENPSVDAGKTIEYNIKFQNNFDTPLQDLYLTAKLEGVMFQLNTLKTNGYFDVNTNTITWGPREIPALKVLNPKQVGSASFEIGLKSIFPILSFNDKEFFVKVSFNIGTKIVPPLIGVKEISQSVDVITKINTNLILLVKGFYRENFSSIQNFGPIPPRVGQTTTFTLHWQIINVSNDIEDLIITSTLPTGVKWMNAYNATFKREGISYDETTKKITWNVGRVPATTGLAYGLPVYEAVFQVAINPGPQQVGQGLRLLDESIARAKDSYTGIELEVKAPAKFTTSLDDLSIKREDLIVKP